MTTHQNGLSHRGSGRNLLQFFAALKTCFLLFIIPCSLLLDAAKAKGQTTSSQNEFYVSPAGTSSGNGTQSNPWDLQTALNHPSTVTPGSTIYLMNGTYTGTFTSRLNGTATQPIIVKPAPGARAVLDGNLSGQSVKNLTTLNVYGSYTWLMGFEITNSDPVRVISQSGSNPPERRGNSIDVFGVGIKVINLVIYDSGQGIGAWSTAENNEYYGNIIFNNGWWAPDREHGHGVYAQNNIGTKKFINNIVLNNFSYGFIAYGSEVSYLKNFYLEGNTLFNDRLLIGGSSPMENIHLKGNLTFRDTLEFGYYEQVINRNLTLEENIFSSNVNIKSWQNITATKNLFYTGASYGYPITFMFNGAPDVSTYKFDYNSYYWSSPPSPYQPEIAFNWFNLQLPGGDPNRSGIFYFTQWKQMGKDVNSSVYNFPLQDNTHYQLSGKKVFLQKNLYDTKRATITIYNWDNSEKVEVDVSQVLKAGDSYRLRNVQNYFGDVITGIYTGGLLSVPMTNHTVAKPLGYSSQLGANTNTEFGCFILEVIPSFGPLPVQQSQLSDFTAVQQNRTVELQWQTAQEKNIDHYAVERSENGTSYKTIGKVYAQRAQLPLKKYKFLDQSPASTNYYRIKEVDPKGGYIYSKVVRVILNDFRTDFTINPNPVYDMLNLYFQLYKPETVNILVKDAQGKLMLSMNQAMNTGQNVVRIPVSQLTKGMYYVTAIIGNQVITKLLVKQ